MGELAVVAAALAIIPTARGASADSGRPSAVCQGLSDTLPVDAARLLDFGDYRGAPASPSAQAQRFFDQGLVFGWGFNFAEAVRSFRAAAKLDPACALCRWGIAWALGPSVNHDMDPTSVPVAIDAIVQARTYAAAGSRTRLLIDALAERYSDRADADQDRLARSYAKAMRAVAQNFPNDPDMLVLAAEAAMTAHAYDYWHADGRPKGWTPEVAGWLDRALQLAPTHPGAHHYRIHLFEDSRQPERALASAVQLGALVPIVGHLMHMPSHIFFRIGRYRDALLANRAAVQADRAYGAATGTETDYAVHNLHYLWVSALWADDHATALEVADQLATASAVGETPNALSQQLMAAPWLTRVRFGQWDAVARQTAPASEPGSKPYLQGLMHFASGMADAARGDVKAAATELVWLQRAERAARAAGLTIKTIDEASDALSVARFLLLSAIATARGVHDDAVRYARQAVVAEDRLASGDPPLWVVPARHALAAALLRTGRAGEAKDVYLADLRRHPKNCAALAGVTASDSKLRSSAVASASAVQRVVDYSSHCPE
ncbi:MAG: hypothetical protein ABJA83_06250 [Burkholderiaceae bacterium]